MSNHDQNFEFSFISSNWLRIIISVFSSYVVIVQVREVLKTSVVGEPELESSSEYSEIT